MMKRYAYDQLCEWRDSATRKPLIVRGARQVGKTTLLKQFAKEAFENFAYLNFEESPKLSVF